MSTSIRDTRPPVVAANKFVCGSSTGVTSCGVIMVGVDYLSVQVFVVRNIQEAINEQ